MEATVEAMEAMVVKADMDGTAEVLADLVATVDKVEVTADMAGLEDLEALEDPPEELPKFMIRGIMAQASQDV